MLFSGNFKAELTVPEGTERDKGIATDLPAAGMEDILLDLHT